LGRYQEKHRDPADCQRRLRVLSHKVGSLDLQFVCRVTRYHEKGPLNRSMV
jgi:hypothetical protein